MFVGCLFVGGMYLGVSYASLTYFGDMLRRTAPKFGVYVYGITLWNALRTEIKSKNSVNAFKKSCTKYIISDYE